MANNLVIVPYYVKVIIAPQGEGGPQTKVPFPAKKHYRPAFRADASGSGGFGCSGLPSPASSRIQRRKA